jgi:hypothetical protein
LNLIAPGTFGKPDPSGYAYGLIPIGGTAYGAIQSFHQGNYASGAAGAVTTVVELAFAVYAAVSAGASGYSQYNQLRMAEDNFGLVIKTPFQQSVTAALSYLGKIIVHDLYAAGVGIAAKPIVFAWDLRDLATDALAGNIGAVATDTIGLVLDAAFPTYGYYGGLGWGTRQFQDHVPLPLNQVDFGNLLHDMWGDNLNWVRDVWTWTGPTVPPGPFGIAYAALGTVPFTVGGLAQGILH